MEGLKLCEARNQPKDSVLTLGNKWVTRCWRKWRQFFKLNFFYCHSFFHSSRRRKECIKARWLLCQGLLPDSSRRMKGFVKEFFKKSFIFSQKSCQVFLAFFMKKTAYYGLFQGINNKNYINCKKNMTGFIFFSYFCRNYDIGIKGACQVPSLVLVEIDRKFR